MGAGRFVIVGFPGRRRARGGKDWVCAWSMLYRMHSCMDEQVARVANMRPLHRWCLANVFRRGCDHFRTASDTLCGGGVVTRHVQTYVFVRHTCKCLGVPMRVFLDVACIRTDKRPWSVSGGNAHPVHRAHGLHMPVTHTHGSHKRTFAGRRDHACVRKSSDVLCGLVYASHTYRWAGANKRFAPRQYADPRTYSVDGSVLTSVSHTCTWQPHGNVS